MTGLWICLCIASTDVTFFKKNGPFKKNLSWRQDLIKCREYKEYKGNHKAFLKNWLVKKWHHKNLFSTIWHLDKNFTCHIVAVIALARFCIVTHSYAASFSRKVILCETNNIFCSREYWVWHKVKTIFWKFIKNKVEVMLDFCMETGLRNISKTSNARLHQGHFRKLL